LHEEAVKVLGGIQFLVKGSRFVAPAQSGHEVGGTGRTGEGRSFRGKGRALVDGELVVEQSCRHWFEEGGATTHGAMVLDNTPGLRVGNLAFFDCRRAGGGAVTTWFNQADFFVDFPLRDPADVQGIVLGGDTDQAGVRRPWL